MPFRYTFVPMVTTMPKRIFLYLSILYFFLLVPDFSRAQCSICTKTAQQMGEKPAKALNGAIIYLAFVPLVIIGYVGYRWYSSNREA